MASVRFCSDTFAPELGASLPSGLPGLPFLFSLWLFRPLRAALALMKWPLCLGVPLAFSDFQETGGQEEGPWEGSPE